MHILRSSYKVAIEAACDTTLIQVIGPKGCGKTTLVLDVMKSKNHVFYFSFEAYLHKKRFACSQSASLTFCVLKAAQIGKVRLRQ